MHSIQYQLPWLTFAPLQTCTHTQVKFLPECVGASIEAATRECAPGTILLLEVGVGVFLVVFLGVLN